MVRPLFWLDPADEALRKIDDAFMLGDDLLVAPVLAQGALERFLTLPTGIWYDFWEDTRLVGAAQVTLPASLERIPVLVRGGSLIPMDEAGRLALHAYPIPGVYSSLVYEDAGDGYGATRVDRYVLSLEEDRLRLRRESLGEYKPDYAKISIIFHGTGPNDSGIQDVVVDGQPLHVKGDRFDCDPFEEITLRFNPAG